MSIQTTSYVLKNRFGNQTRKLIMIVIADFANDDGEAWPSIDTLANKAECSRRSIQEHLATLQRQGHLAIHINAGPHGCNLYRVIFRKNEEKNESFTPEPIPCEGGANPARGVQMSNAQTAGGGANERRQSAPEPLGTTKELSGEREGASAPLPPSAASPDPITYQINGLDPAYQAAPVLNAKERQALNQNLPALQAVAPESWRIVRDYLRAKIPQGVPKYQPKSRLRLLEDFPDVLRYAIEFERKQPKTKAPQPTPQHQPQEPGMTTAEIAAFFATNKTA